MKKVMILMVLSLLTSACGKMPNESAESKASLEFGRICAPLYNAVEEQTGLPTLVTVITNKAVVYSYPDQVVYFKLVGDTCTMTFESR